MIDSKTHEFVATGRRKTSTARVRLASGTGKVLVNGRAFETYFPTDSLRTLALRPLTATSSGGKYDIRVNVNGGGPAGQAGAVSLGVKLACAADYRAHCSMLAVGSPGVRKCMRAVGRNLSQGCISALVAAGEVSKSVVERRVATK